MKDPATEITQSAVVHSFNEHDRNDVRSYHDDSDNDPENAHVEEPNFKSEFQINGHDSDKHVILNAKETQDEHEKIFYCRTTNYPRIN